MPKTSNKVLATRFCVKIFLLAGQFGIFMENEVLKVDNFLRSESYRFKRSNEI